MPKERDFELLFRQHYAPTVRAVTATLGDRQIAEEAVQEGFTRAFAGIHKLREQGRFAGWVYVISVNYGRQLLRRRNREVSWEGLPALPRKLSGGADGADGTLMHRERVQAVRHALEHLPVQYRQVLILHYWYELSTAEIGRLLGTKTGTVKSRLHRARSAMREWLDLREVDL